MVVIARPSTVSTGVTQERVAAPSMCTVQAPHWEIPQPYFVPVRPRLSLRTQRRGVEGSTSTSCRLPLTVIAIIAVPPLRKDGGDGITFLGSVALVTGASRGWGAELQSAGQTLAQRFMARARGSDVSACGA